jgi:hypothetical protein
LIDIIGDAKPPSPPELPPSAPAEAPSPEAAAPEEAGAPEDAAAEPEPAAWLDAVAPEEAVAEAVLAAAWTDGVGEVADGLPPDAAEEAGALVCAAGGLSKPGELEAWPDTVAADPAVAEAAGAGDAAPKAPAWVGSLLFLPKEVM